MYYACSDHLPVPWHVPCVVHVLYCTIHVGVVHVQRIAHTVKTDSWSFDYKYEMKLYTVLRNSMALVKPVVKFTMTKLCINALN